MFWKSRKRQNNSKGIKWYTWLIDLIIVFVGVYLAFWLGNYNEEQKHAKQRSKVLSTLKFELERFRVEMPGFASYQQKKITEWQAALAKDSITEFYQYLYIQPQYDYTILEYAINVDEVEVVNYELFTPLRQLYNDIKALESAENLMTETAQKFRNISSYVPKKSLEYKARLADNRFYFFRFIQFAVARQRSLAKIAKRSEEALVIINAGITPERRVEIEQQLIASHLQRLDQLPPKQQAIAQIKELFPNLTEQEYLQVIQQFY